MLGIQMPSYKVEAELIGFEELPPLKDTVETLIVCGEDFYGYYLDSELCGAIAIKREEEIIDIHRLMVHPEHFRKGIAKELLLYVERLAGSEDVIVVATGTENVPAVSFYKQSGFVETDVFLVEGQLSITSFQKKT
ncbi:GNAT superfamily N-acetyltransferase [Paenibacillus endophyticus]|uniref:GNAT superfamily N-acetyltransferase n=1 Tax=Paenibacillus endophyticus TaxID=1294268 RepID=A0A7W5CA26_9BACL|nr:GNAT family N-acetyltransferase [Paenibacillus endophyticus]MBB3153404.1 GNAT superfamily N-acetyltransferase [Paenibacillus endophyticus]